MLRANPRLILGLNKSLMKRFLFVVGIPIKSLLTITHVFLKHLDSSTRPHNGNLEIPTYIKQGTSYKKMSIVLNIFK